MPSYVESAPKILINWYEKRTVLKGRDLLGRLLTHVEMEAAWSALRRHAKCRDFETRLFREIVVIEQASRKPPVKRRTEERDEFLQIAEQARLLSRAILNGPLDRLVCAYFAAETMDTNGVPGWDQSDALERINSAHAVLAEWPPIIDILDSLSVRAEKLAAETMANTRIVDRVSDSTETFRRLYFVRTLSEFIVSEYGRPLRSTVASITNTILGTSIIDSEVRKFVKTTKDT